MNSELFKLKAKDFIKGLVMFVLAAIITFVYNSMTDCGGIDCVIWDDALNAGIVASLAYLMKNFFTDSQGKLGGKI
jgi:hypothetical protein